MEIKTLLEQRGLLIFDGAMGTQLQAKGLKTGETPELLNLTAKDLLKDCWYSVTASRTLTIWVRSSGRQRLPAHTAW